MNSSGKQDITNYRAIINDEDSFSINKNLRVY